MTLYLVVSSAYSPKAANPLPITVISQSFSKPNQPSKDDYLLLELAGLGLRHLPVHHLDLDLDLGLGFTGVPEEIRTWGGE